MNAIVLTTINIAQNITEFIKKARNEWIPIVVGDLKTPHDALAAICKEAHGVYLSPDTQMTLGFSHAGALPWNCYDRKNIGYLFALREGAEIIYSIDDDNYPPDHWDLHVKLGEQHVDVARSDCGWWNYFSLTEESITPRGYPVWLIQDKRTCMFEEDKSVDVGVQVGICLGDPDVDAMTRLIRNPVITTYPDRDVALERGTMCPYNSQNTFISREMMPAHMLWCGARTEFYRYDDILTSYVAQVIGWHHGKAIKFGRPFLRQARNPHDFLKDLRSEIGGMECQEPLLSILRSMEFRSKHVGDNLRQAIYAVLERIPQLPRNLKVQVDTWCSDLEKIGV